MALRIMYPVPGQDGMPVDPPERKLQRKAQRRSPAEWGQLFRPFTALFALPTTLMDEALANAPAAFWDTLVEWWKNACEPLDIPPAPEIYRPPSLDEGARRRRPVVETTEGEDPHPVVLPPTLDDLLMRDDGETG
jgi:hypothetical protein